MGNSKVTMLPRGQRFKQGVWVDHVKGWRRRAAHGSVSVGEGRMRKDIGWKPGTGARRVGRGLEG